MKLLVHRPSPALVVALVALFSSLASGATAAKLLTGKQIKNRSITGPRSCAARTPPAETGSPGV